MNVDNIDVAKYSVSQLFNQDESFVYEVPKYQREYKWKMREWEALYDDLTENEAGYFLGSVIYINKSHNLDTRFEVVDGQQRCYFWWKFVGETDYISMGAWWDRKGENEIDLVCERPSKAGVRSALDFFEVKRDATRLNMDALKRKAESFFVKNPEKRGGRISFAGLSLKDM